MEIFFCSHCNQSIPLKDIQSGSAELRRGKYLCATCREFVPGHREKKPNYAAMYLSIVLVGSLVVVGYLIFQEDLFPPPSPAPSSAHDARFLAGTLRDIRTDLGAVEERLRLRLEEGFGDFASRLTKQAGAISLAMSRLDALRSRIRPEETSADTLMLKSQIEGLGREIGSLHKSVAALEASLAGIKESLDARPAAAPEAAPAPKPEPVISEADRWIAQLNDPVPGKRFSAVAELTRFKGPQVDAALIGRLGDEDFFIRRFVAEELGERRTEAAVPRLVGALEDDEESVREAAVLAVRKITGKNFGFKSGASSRERARALTRWRNHVAGLAKKK